MAQAIKLIQLNIERGRHFEHTLPFFEQEAPDIVSVQEVFIEQIPQLKQTIGGHAVFEPMSFYDGHEHGVAVVTKHNIVNHAVYQLGEYGEKIPAYDESTFETKYQSSRFVVLVADIEVNGVVYRVATTHLPVTKRAEVTEYQRVSATKLLEVLRSQGECILTGDFNAPRGGEIFSLLTSQCKDNVPDIYKTSIDITLHRNGKERPHELADKMVDGIFSTPAYSVQGLRMEGGVSDHLALIASVKKL